MGVICINMSGADYVLGNFFILVYSCSYGCLGLC